MADDTRADLRKTIDDIEGAYEFFLAYAAQGLTRKPGGDSRVTAQFEEHVTNMAEALTALPGLLERLVQQEDGPVPEALGGFQAVVRADAEKAAAAVAVVRAHEFASSQLVDNLNASVHIRALLTDLFLIDEALGLEASESDEAS